MNPFNIRIIFVDIAQVKKKTSLMYITTYLSTLRACIKSYWFFCLRRIREKLFSLYYLLCVPVIGFSFQPRNCVSVSILKSLRHYSFSKRFHKTMFQSRMYRKRPNTVASDRSMTEVWPTFSYQNLANNILTP